MWTEIIRLNYPVLSKAQRQAADYLLTHQEIIENETIRVCAKEAGVGQPTVLRTLHKCGYESWSEFLQAVWKDQGRASNQMVGVLDGSEKYKGRFKSVLASMENDIRMISDMTSKLDLYQLDEVARLIRHAKIVDIYGTDNSSNAASELAGRFLHLGLNSRNYSDLFFQKISAVHLGKKDIAIGFSISGETIAVIQALQYAKESGAKTVAVTGDDNSTLAKEADFIFLTPTIYTDVTSKWIASRITQIAFVDALCAAFMNSDAEHFKEELKKSTQGFNEDISERARV